MKSIVVANTRSWSFIVENSKETILVSSVMQSYSMACYEASVKGKNG
jgi:hypothetical protein